MNKCIFMYKNLFFDIIKILIDYISIFENLLKNKKILQAIRTCY